MLCSRLQDRVYVAKLMSGNNAVKPLLRDGAGRFWPTRAQDVSVQSYISLCSADSLQYSTPQRSSAGAGQGEPNRHKSNNGWRVMVDKAKTVQTICMTRGGKLTVGALYILFRDSLPLILPPRLHAP